MHHLTLLSNLCQTGNGDALILFLQTLDAEEILAMCEWLISHQSFFIPATAILTTIFSYLVIRLGYDSIKHLLDVLYGDVYVNIG